MELHLSITGLWLLLYVIAEIMWHVCHLGRLEVMFVLVLSL